MTTEMERREEEDDRRPGEHSGVTIFGRALRELRLEDVAAFLADAEPEPLLWEAKGIAANAHEVRRQVCGFANSHDGGDLVIGAHQADDGFWTLDGVEFPDEPPIWVSNVVGSGGVNPYPDGLDTCAWATSAGRHVAVVAVPPIATPPCNARGTVYERVSGKTISVREPLRLAELFARGDQARRDAEAKARRAAFTILTRGRSHPAHGVRHVQFGLGLAAAGYLPDISSRLFHANFEQAAVSSIRTVLDHDPLQPPGGPGIAPDVTQDSRLFEVRAADARLGSSWLVRATWDGAIGIYWVQGVDQTAIDSIVKGPVRHAWMSADELLDELAPQGPRYLQVAMAGGSFPPNRTHHPGEILPDPSTAARGPINRGVDEVVLASIERELRRATGEMAYES
jgi:hypothetical protein